MRKRFAVLLAIGVGLANVYGVVSLIGYSIYLGDAYGARVQVPGWVAPVLEVLAFPALYLLRVPAETTRRWFEPVLTDDGQIMLLLAALNGVLWGLGTYALCRAFGRRQRVASRAPRPAV
jgi:hypothetical protein